MAPDFEPRYSAEYYVRLGRMALAQARATLHQPTARVLREMAERCFAKARELGWDKPTPSESDGPEGFCTD